MEAVVRGEFGVERGAEDAALAHGHTLPSEGGEGPYLRPVIDHDRSANEHPEDFAHPFDRDFRLKRVDLGPKGIAADDDVEQSQAILIVPLDLAGKQDHAHTRPPHRHPRSGAFDEGGPESEAFHQLAHRGTLAAGDDHAVHFGEVFRSPDLKPRDPDPAERLEVLLEIALNRHNAHAVCHRSPKDTNR